MTARPPLLVSLSLGLAIALSACGDDNAPGSAADAGGDGAGSEADASPAPDSGAPASATAFAVATDFFTAGVASTVSVPGLEVHADAIEGVASTDPVVRLQGDRLFVINRFGQDNVTILDAARVSLVDQISTGAGSNPQDVAQVGDRLYVAALGAPGILVLDPARPDAGVVDTIDLSDLDPDDGLPDCGSVVALGDQIVAVCGILGDDAMQTPRGPGVVALIDGARGELIDTAPLTQIRPFGLVQGAPSGDAVLIATVDSFAQPASGGCVERVAVGPGTIESDGCVVNNADLGGFVSALAWSRAGDQFWITVTTSFDPEDGGAHGDLVSVPAGGGTPVTADLADDFRPMDLAICPTGHLVVSDATRGVRVLAPGADRELTSAPLDIGLPPVSNGLVCY
ncbi:MAG TPA: hypothetical protein VKB80_01310 [Kofleriaceae bacterium]|nr:hypothetical protein [Kofleriaceae bacterium]